MQRQSPFKNAVRYQIPVARLELNQTPGSRYLESIRRTTYMDVIKACCAANPCHLNLSKWIRSEVSYCDTYMYETIYIILVARITFYF